MANRKDSAKTTISVKDFGPIADATVELRPFTVFVGASNTGKSYLAILLYALHRFFGGPVGADRRPWPFSLYQYPPRVGRSAPTEQLEAARAWLAQVPASFRGNSNRGVDVKLPDDVAALVRGVLEDAGELAPLLDAEVGRCFGVADTKRLIRQSGGTSARIALRRDVRVDAVVEKPILGYEYSITRSQSQLGASIPAGLPLRIQGVDGRYLRWRVGPPIRHLRTLPGALADLVLPYVVGALTRPVHYLPADRAGVMHAHRVVVSSLIGRASRGGLGPESPLPSLSGVLADFLEQLIELGDAKPGKGAGALLAERLEADILAGVVSSHRSAVGYPSFHYRPQSWKSELPLMNTSSMVSELAPVVLYLRHIVRPGDVIIIEEPESHLHPRMQVSFTRLLAAVARAGIRVVVTTHSEWVLEALANIVRLSAVEPSRRQGICGDDLALTPDQVGAWHFEAKKRPKGSVVKEIPLDIARGTFPAGFREITEELYNDWAEIANLVAEKPGG